LELKPKTSRKEIIGKRQVSSRFRKTVSVEAEVMSDGRLFQRGLSTGNTRPPIVRKPSMSNH